MALNPRRPVIITDHPIEFFEDGNGDPWAIFCWGEAPASAFEIDQLVESVICHSNLTREQAQELIGLGIDPKPHWLRLELDAYFFCDRTHPKAQRITGARF